MNKKLIIIVTVIATLALSGCSYFSVSKTTVSQTTNSGITKIEAKNSAVENIVPKSDAEVNNKICVTTGKAYYPPKENCCKSLTTIFGSELPSGKCGCTEKDNTCGGSPICAPCGNKKCEKEYGEDKCNCPVDCE